jgi:hypothetical protein
MSAIANGLKGVLGLFFDDGTLALVILAVLLATGFARYEHWIGELGAICILLAGTIAALFENVLRFARRKNHP